MAATSTNSLLTIDMVTNEALRILHQKLNFIGNINRQYDDSFAKNGAKIGTNLRAKLPPRYESNTGSTFVTNNSTENYVNVPCSTQRHVGMSFTSKEFTMDIDSFGDEFLEPAMAQLASDMEYDALSNLYKEVYASVGTPGTTPNSFKTVSEAAGKIRQNGLVNDDQLSLLLNVDANIELSDALKGLQNPSKNLSENYRKGMLASGAAGFNGIFENTLLPVHTNGTDVTGVAIDDAGAAIASGDTEITVDGVTNTTGTITAGSVFTIENVYAVHPETRQSTGKLQQFVVTANATGSGSTDATLSISPAIITSGAFQTVDSLPADDAALTFLGSDSGVYDQNIAFHKDAFTFVTADLVKPSGSVEFCSQKTYDGLTLRILRQYDAREDEFITRADVIYGFKTLRPELAARIWGS